MSNKEIKVEYVTRIHLKTGCLDDKRKELVNFCLDNKQQYLAIGWYYVYEDGKINSFQDYYEAVKNKEKRINHVINVFRDVKKNDLFWTRDLDGCYWVCRVKDGARIHKNEELDIGAIIPVEAYKVGMEVPGQIKASFNRARGGVSESISEDIIVQYSMFIYNKFSNTETYSYCKIQGSILDNLPDFDLEELVISYLQIEKNYYVLSNSIANKSTTIKIECEFISRDIKSKEKAVVQVGGKNKGIDALDYLRYAEDGYKVYFFINSDNEIQNIKVNKNFVQISKKELESFYKKYKVILPKSITMWEYLFA